MCLYMVVSSFLIAMTNKLLCISGKQKTERQYLLFNFLPDRVHWKFDVWELREVILSNYGRHPSNFRYGKVV